jgi:molecular chaperone GrpE
LTDQRKTGDPAEPERVVVRDKRKIDPVTGQARPAPGPMPDAPERAAPAEPSADAALLAERTADLQRLQAEYANYRKRTDRDRLAAGEVAVSRVLAELLPVLDDIDRARSHGDLTGGLKAIADHLELVFGKLGLEAFGEPGDPFDPTIHEAVMHNESDDVDVPTSTTVMRKGYRHGERLLRPAMVGVTDPASPAAEPSAPAPSDDQSQDQEPAENDDV